MTLVAYSKLFNNKVTMCKIIEFQLIVRPFFIPSFSALFHCSCLLIDQTQ